MCVLATQRLMLRPVTLDDVEDIYAYSSDPEVGPNAGWKPHASREETRQVIREMFQDQETVWGITLKGTNRLIGSVGLIADEKRCNDGVRMIGYSLAKPHWGNGVMTEAVLCALQYGFQRKGLAMISAYCYSHNTRSRRVLEKCGMRYEGTLRMGEKLYDNTVCDEHCFSITQEEYRRQLGELPL